MRAVRRIIATLATVLLMAGGLAAQTFGTTVSSVLVIDSEELFAQSEFGQRVSSEIEADQARHLAENRKIEAELTAEEKRLTEQRPEMDPGDFRAEADAFDDRVQEIRRIQDEKARKIVQRRDRARVAFLRAATPVLGEIMQNSGANVIFERNSVFLLDESIDITDRAIDRINEAIGEGADLLQEVDEDSENVGGSDEQVPPLQNTD
ncbi:chaperone for outer membrane proteins, Skp family [Salinihabitans flavidus]|uniref:Chaperone for outer membrane proteins, Skp family n=1 Tax=Salinihabitans flavidus TaxID=569882 RepID=A0A1H8NF76_9RHOB|nr:OmpH family outer membrane protein [Salinihabitans flavidus]SEO28053.1 chaperone for outer membrane proteins, Skp family [Salinihabitans flavidus]